MDIRDELRAILAASMPGNDNRQAADSLRVEVVHSGRIEHVLSLAAGPSPAAGAGPPAAPPSPPLALGRLVLHPAPWVRRILARKAPPE
jgi:hypothetical protein